MQNKNSVKEIRETLNNHAHNIVCLVQSLDSCERLKKILHFDSALLEEIENNYKSFELELKQEIDAFNKAYIKLNQLKSYHICQDYTYTLYLELKALGLYSYPTLTDILIEAL